MTQRNLIFVRNVASQRCVEKHRCEPCRFARVTEVSMARIWEEVEVDTGEVSRYRRHGNGRGFVAVGATVDATAFLSERVYVEKGARVGARAWIGAGSWIEGGATVGVGVFVGANVRIGRDATVGAGARLGSHSRIGVAATIAPASRVPTDARIAANTVVGQREVHRAAA